MATYTVLDLSKYNTVTNYTSIANAVNGVIIRAGYRGYGSSGTLTTDTKFETYYAGLNGKTKIGVYWLSQAITTTEAVAEADYVYNLIKNKTIHFPVYLDSEYSNSSHNGRADSLSKSARTNITIAFCDRIKALGYRAGVYASDSWFNSNLDWSTLYARGYSLWVAKYSSTAPQIVKNYDAWQYTSSGSCNGVSGNVDLSRFYNDVAGWNSTPVSSKVDINNLTLDLPTNQFSYTGSAIQCPFGLKFGSSYLTPQTDFTYSYSNNVNSGQATCTITGIGNYTGSRYFNYYINPIDISSMTLTFDYDPTYNGSTHYAYNLKLYSSTFGYLRYDTDYRVGGYEGDTTNVGWVSFYVKGLYNDTGANFTGSKWGSYRINAASLDSSAFYIDQPEYIYTGTNITPTVRSTKYTQGTDYSVSYSNNVNIGTATITITGINNYTGTVTLHFNISTMNIANYTLTLDPYTFYYDPSISKYEPAVTLGSLRQNTDFSVAYSNNTEPGTGTVTVTGINNYTGTKSTTFTIVRLTLASYTLVVEEPTLIYNKKARTPKCSIKNLTEGVDYKLDFYNNIDPGTATVVATGINKYSGQISSTFTIKYASITSCVAEYGYKSAVSRYRVDNGVFKVYYDATLDPELVLDEDYVVQTKTVTEKPLYTEVSYLIKGLGGFSGEVQYTFNTITEDEEETLVSESMSLSTSISESMSTSASISASESASVSESISTSVSQSVSTSISEYQSQSASISESQSISNSISVSESISVSQSLSTIASIAESSSISESASIAESESISNSISMSIAISESESTSAFISESISVSESASIAESMSYSMSESVSMYISESESISASTSISESESESASISEYQSQSESLSVSESVSESISVSTSISESLSTSESESASLSEWTSNSMEFEDTEIWSYSGDFDFGEYAYDSSEPPQIIVIVDPDSVANGDYDYNLSSEEDSSGEEPVPDVGFDAGTVFELNNTPIYTTYSVGKSFDVKSGTYYVYNSALMNGRIRVCRLEESIEAPAKSAGWCKVDDLLGLTTFVKGDKVTVTGKLYISLTDKKKYIEMENETMYVREVHDTENYDTPYGLSFEVNSAVIGYASYDQLSKEI